MERRKFDPAIFSQGTREQAERQLSIFNDEIWDAACTWGARRYNLTIQDVEDQMQWVLNKIWNRRDIFNSLPDLRGFLYKVLGWRCLQFIKRRKGHLPTVEAILEDESYYSNNYEHKNFTKASIEYVSLRNPMWGKVLYLYYVEGFDSREIEGITGAPISTVNYIKQKSIRLLTEWYRNDERASYILPPKDLWGKIAHAVREVRIRVPQVKSTPRIKMRPFEEAREFVRSLKFTEMKQWEAFCRTDARPKDIPMYPRTAYKAEYIDHYDWLGTEGLASYEEVEKFMREVMRPMGILTGIQWDENYDRFRERGIIPPNIPKKVDTVYKGKGFTRWGIMMGTNAHVRRKDEEILPYHLAREWVQKNLVPLGITNFDKYRSNGTLIPYFLPVDPIEHYGSACKGPADFFGVYKRLTKYTSAWPYEKARQWVIKNLANSKHDISTSSRWMDYIAGRYPKAPKLPDMIPKDPRYYKRNGAQWVDWNHWFGKDENIKQREKDTLAATILHLRHAMLMTWEQITTQTGISESKARKIYNDLVPEEDRPDRKEFCYRILTEEQVIQIRKEYETGKYSRRELADKYEVSDSAIQAVIERKNWKHIA